MRTGSTFTLSAQNMAYENGSWWLPGVEVSGRSKTQCVWCGNYYYADEAADHVCMQECEYCHQLVDYFSYYEHIQKVHLGNSDDDNEQIASMPLVEHGGSFECVFQERQRRAAWISMTCGFIKKNGKLVLKPIKC